MPTLSVRFIRVSFLYLLVGFSLGALILAEKGVSYFPAIWTTFAAHQEFLLVGWLIQLAMGVGFWIFPRFGSGAIRGNERLVTASFWLLNIGILVTVLQAWVPFALASGRALEMLAMTVYIGGSWNRIKPLGLTKSKS